MEDSLDLSLLKSFFHITLTGEEDAVFSIPAIELLKPEQMDIVIRQSAQLYNALGLDLAASFIGLAFFNLCASHQIILAVNNRFLDLTLANLTFQIQAHGDHAHTCFKINELRWKEPPQDNRYDWLTYEMQTYYKDNIIPILEIVALSAGVKPDLIWNQFGGKMAYGVDYILEHEQREDVRNRVLQDYEFLANQLPPETFGQKKNPFFHKPRYVDSPYVAGKKTMIRSSCCLIYRRENGVKCFSCPQLLPEERAVMRTKILEQSGT